MRQKRSGKVHIFRTRSFLFYTSRWELFDVYLLQIKVYSCKANRTIGITLYRIKLFSVHFVKYLRYRKSFQIIVVVVVVVVNELYILCITYQCFVC